jgi:drug/metabolite transporter (DMT)-like permease
MRLRVWLLTVVVVLANVGGNAILGYAMQQAPTTAGVIGSILQPVAIVGIVVLTAWMLLRMRLLGLADLSFVVPVTAIGYVLSALAGVFLLHEHVPLRGWIGTVIIMAGATLTGLTDHGNALGNNPSKDLPVRSTHSSEDRPR